MSALALPYSMEYSKRVLFVSRVRDMFATVTGASESTSASRMRIWSRAVEFAIYVVSRALREITYKLLFNNDIYRGGMSRIELTLSDND